MADKNGPSKNLLLDFEEPANRCPRGGRPTDRPGCSVDAPLPVAPLFSDFVRWPPSRHRSCGAERDPRAFGHSSHHAVRPSNLSAPRQSNGDLRPAQRRTPVWSHTVKNADPSLIQHSPVIRRIPRQLAATISKTQVSENNGILLEARGGIEPPNKGFADLCLTTWLPRRNCDGLRRQR
jgi:hypothetical protein